MNAPAPAPTAYVELGVQSNFSFLRGASRPEELVRASCCLGHAGMGLADRNTVAGTVRAWSQARHVRHASDAAGIVHPYHPGCRLVFADGTPDILAYPRDRKGWGHLCRMLTEANLREESQKGAPLLYLGDLLEWGGRMSLAVLPALAAPADDLALLCRLKERFGEALRLAVAPDYGGDDHFRIEQAAAVAHSAGLPLMATNDVLYHAPERRFVQDVVTAIRLNVPVAEAGLELAANAERHLKPPREMARLFRRHPEAVAETLRFAGELAFSLDELKHNYPDETSAEGIDPQDELERLTWQGARRRYPQGISGKVRGLIRYELAIVAQKNYARYFLTVHDIVRFARSKDVGILCQGRGSAANSVICYCLGITEVDPDLAEVLFERFVSTERDEPPDIDVDFEHERRDEVIAYIYEKYSEKRTALAAAVVSYRGRSALREVAKAMGLSEDVPSALAGSIWGQRSSTLGDREARTGGLDRADPLASHVIACANAIMGFPRHLSQHVGGFVITRDRLDEIVPIVKTGMDERRMVEWDKDDLDTVKILKVDVLALGMLSCLRRAFALLGRHYDARDGKTGRRIVDLDTIPKEDSRVYDMICRADTLGVFQIESRAQMSMLPRLRPREFYDLVIEVAIVRPGPIQGDMVHPYLRRRMGKEKVDYPDELMEKILSRTLGVPLFQEQAMSIAIEAGGFSPSEADQLRRAMATFRRNGTIEQYRTRMTEGMIARGYDRDFAERCFRQIEGFGDYGFPESHAASFALLVYASCWFKAFYPDIFCAALLNSQPMGFYQPAQLVRDARDHGVEVRGVDINFSDWDCLLEEATFDPARVVVRHRGMRGVICARHAVRLGFRQVKGLSRERMETVAARRGAGYRSIDDVRLRSGLDAGELEKLAQADAFRSIGLDRRAALWAVRALDGRCAGAMLPLLDRPGAGLRDLEPETKLPAMPPGEHVLRDYRSLGLSLKAHPVAFVRRRLDDAGVTPNAALPSVADGRRVAVAGLVLVRQRPGKGNAIFLTLEDDRAIANVIVWPRIFDRYRPVIMGARFVRVAGRLQSESGVIHIVADRIDDLTPWLADLLEESRTGPAAAAAAKPSGPSSSVSEREDVETMAHKARSVMPRGRNFH